MCFPSRELKQWLIIIIKLHYTQTFTPKPHSLLDLPLLCPLHHILTLSLFRLLFRHFLSLPDRAPWRVTREKGNRVTKVTKVTKLLVWIWMPDVAWLFCTSLFEVGQYSHFSGLFYQWSMLWSIFLYQVTQYFSRWSSVILTVYELSLMRQSMNKHGPKAVKVVWLKTEL